MGLRRTKQRVLIAASATLVLSIGLLYLPVRADPSEYNVNGTVSCGSLILQSHYAGDGSCEEVHLRLYLTVMLGGLITVLLTLVGCVMWLVEVRRE